MLDVPLADDEQIAAKRREDIARRVEDINAFATCLNHLVARPARRKPVLHVIQGGRVDG